MKYLLILSCLLCTSVGWSKDISMDDLVEREELYYEKFKDVPFTGKVTGQKQGKIRKGIKVGEWVEYWDSGQIEVKESYKNGELDGEQLEYYENGQLEKTLIYKDGKYIKTITP